MSHANSEVVKSGGGLMEDFINIFIKPSEVFEHNRNKGFAMPALLQMVVWVVLAVALKNLMQPFIDADFARGMAKAAAKAAASGQPMPANATAMAEKFKDVGSYALPLIAPWINALVGGAFISFAAKIFSAPMSYSQGATISAWAYMPALLGTIATAVMGVVLDTDTIRGMSDGQLGPARFVDPATTPPVLLALLQRIDLFAIWEIVLAGIGISVVGRISRMNGILGAISAWALVTLILTGMASMSG